MGSKTGDFVVFATNSNGLWDCLESEEVVRLVGRWLEDWGAEASVIDKEGRTPVVYVLLHVAPSLQSNPGFVSSSSTKPTIMKDPVLIPAPPTPFRTYFPAELPAIFPPSYEDRTTMYKCWRVDKKSICEDELVAEHLMRNALGAANTDLALALLKILTPMGTKYRRVHVVFFDGDLVVDVFAWIGTIYLLL